MRKDSPDKITSENNPRARQPFAIMAALTVLWVIALGLLSISTANPVTLNRDQILEATDVITAVVEDPRSGRVRVERSWKDVVHEQEVTLPNLSHLRTTLHARLVIPVTASREGWHVTPSKLPDEAPLVYPATEDAQRQLRQLIKNGPLR